MIRSLKDLEYSLGLKVAQPDGDSAYDSNDLFKRLEELGIEPGTKVTGRSQWEEDLRNQGGNSRRTPWTRKDARWMHLYCNTIEANFSVAISCPSRRL
jgi:hypothetical protein